MDETEQQDRTEDPTERRLSEARDRGEVARSRDLAGAVGTIGVLLSLVMVSAPLAYGAKALLQVGLVYRPDPLASDAVMSTALAPGTVLGLIIRPDERRVGKDCVRMCSSRWSP